MISKLRKALRLQNDRIKALSAAYSRVAHSFILVVPPGFYAENLDYAVIHSSLLAPIGAAPALIQDGDLVEVIGPCTDFRISSDLHIHVGRIGVVNRVSNSLNLADVYFREDGSTATFFRSALRRISSESPSGDVWEHSTVEVPGNSVRLPPTSTVVPPTYPVDTSSSVTGRTSFEF